MLGAMRDAYADAVGWVLTHAVDYPAHTIGAIALVIGFVVVYNHRENLGL